MNGTKIIKFGVLAALGAVALALVGFAGMSVVRTNSDVPVAPPIPTWPALTMVYETDGAAISGGSVDGMPARETHRLDFRSATDWTDTVTAGSSVETSAGSFSRVGSYLKLKGNTLTEYDSLSGLTDTRTIADGVTMGAGAFMMPFPVEAPGVTLTRTTTMATVCFQGVCTDNAEGRLYTRSGGGKSVFVDDARGIPLKLGDSFVVHKVEINSARQAIRSAE